MPTAPTVPTKPKNWQFSCFERPQIRLFDHLLKPKMSHFQDLRSSICTTFRFWETRFTANKAFWPLTEAQNVPLSGFEKFKSATYRIWEAQNVPLSGFEKLKMSHLQDLRSSKSPTFSFWETRFTQNKPFWLHTEAQNGPLSGFEKFKKYHF